MARKYTMSKEAIIQRQTAPIKSGYRSELLKKLSNCDTCFLRNVCVKYLTFSEAQRKKGCNDLRTVMLENLKLYAHPELVLARSLAELETEIQISEMTDAKMNRGLSKDRMRLLHLKQKFLDMVFKYGKGTTTTHVHKMKLDEELEFGEDEKEPDTKGVPEGIPGKVQEENEPERNTE